MTAAMYRLTTFGTASLRDASGRDTGIDQGAQRRRLALLAVLAASGERGRSRDELLLLFWPDASQRRARHSLEQLLYAIRNSLDESVFTGVNPLRLNSEVVNSDVEDFERACTRGDFRRAVELYGGSFLAGFHLGGSIEFGQWADTERARLESRYADVLSRLAEEAEVAADHQEAIRWRRKLSDLDPVSGRNALSLMRALARAGDHAAALRHAEQYERLLARELGTRPAAEIASYIPELRSTAAPRPAVPLPAAAGARDGSAGAPSVMRVTDSASSDEATDATAPPPPSATPAPSVSVSPDAVSIETPAAEVQLRSARRLRLVAVAVVAAFAIVLVSLIARGPRQGRSPRDAPSLVILPLVTASRDTASQAFADGMTLELISVLARMGGVRVIASTSAFAFRNHLLDVRRIADSLDVAHVLEGGIQRDRSRIRMSFRLIDGGDGATQWSETYDRDVRDIVSVQEEIGRSVAAQLAVTLSPLKPVISSRHASTNPLAYDLYLRGRHQRELRSDTGFTAAVEYFARAIAADSTYAPAYAGLAEAAAISGLRTRAPSAKRELYSTATSAALKAVTLDPALPEAHFALGALYTQSPINLTLAEAELKRARALNPGHGRTREYLADVYGLLGRANEAVAEARAAISIDPLSVTALREHARALLAARRYEEALAEIRRARSMGPPLRAGPGLTAQILLKLGRKSEAVAEARQMPSRRRLGLILALAGDTIAARKELAETMQQWRQGRAGAYDVAVLHAGLRDYDNAFLWLERSFVDASIQSDIMEPLFDDLRRDARFRSVARRLGVQNL